jgi:hypothetical protein
MDNPHQCPHCNNPLPEQQPYHLSPEQISLAFLCLRNKAKPSPELEWLNPQAWEELAHLLSALEQEQKTYPLQ